MRARTIAVLGAGAVGRTLARAWASAGHQVVLGSRRPDLTRAQDAVAGLGTDVAGTVPICPSPVRKPAGPTSSS